MQPSLQQPDFTDEVEARQRAIRSVGDDRSCGGSNGYFDRFKKRSYYGHKAGPRVDRGGGLWGKRNSVSSLMNVIAMMFLRTESVDLISLMRKCWRWLKSLCRIQPLKTSSRRTPTTPPSRAHRALLLLEAASTAGRTTGTWTRYCRWAWEGEGQCCWPSIVVG